MAHCPFCDYEGAPRSVEAHISGKTDDAHRGKVGSQWRANIRDPLRYPIPDDTPDGVEVEASDSGSEGIEGADTEQVSVGGFGGLVEATSLLALAVLLATSRNRGSASSEDSQLLDEQ